MTQVEQEELLQINENLNKHQVFTELLSKDWIDQNILTQEERLRKHFLFWYILDTNKADSLAADLSVIKNDSKIASFISKIKKYKDRDNFEPFRIELQVYAYYKQRESSNFRVFYEPSVPGNSTKNDILIKHKGEDYCIEIFTLTDDNVDRQNNELQRRVTEEINRLGDDPFIISYRLLTSFEDTDIASLIAFLKKEIVKFKEETNQEKAVIFSIDEVDKCELWLNKDSEIDRGFVGVIHSEVRQYNNSRRIKNLILTKTDQVSTETRNILITNLLYPPIDFDDYYDGLIGQESYNIDRNTREITPLRIQNGAIHDNRTKKFGCFIVFRRDLFRERKKYINPNADNKINEKLFEIL